MPNVERVIVGASGFDGTCICNFEEETPTIKHILEFGFEQGSYP